MIDDYLFQDIPNFPAYLKEVRDRYLKDITDPEKLLAAKSAVDSCMGAILAELKAPIPSARWVLVEYRGDYDSEKQDIVEHVRPASFTVDQYWDQVNG